MLQITTLESGLLAEFRLQYLTLSALVSLYSALINVPMGHTVLMKHELGFLSVCHNPLC